MINYNLFKTKIEKFNPLSSDYRLFWKEEKRKCIEGVWISGVYMPPQLYFYINYWHIKLNKDKGGSLAETNQIIAKPFLRDIEFEKCYIYLEAKGFSGFELDTEFTCDESKVNELNYITTPKYLKLHRKSNLGKPLYNNSIKNVIDIEARGSGKSYLASSFCGHNFLFDGIQDYNEYLNTPNEIYTSATMYGAAVEKFSSNFSNLLQLGLNEIEGDCTFNGLYYPSPFSKFYTGSFKVGQNLIAQEEVTKEGISKIYGSRSIIYHRTFDKDHLSGNGPRPTLVVLDEVGFMHNLRNVLGALKDSTTVGTKVGVIWMTGTGGDMTGKACREVQEVFYNPETYDCLSFKDTYEDKGMIGYFVPRYRSMNMYKTLKEGLYVTNLEEGLISEQKEYDKILNTNDNTAINNHLMNRPLVPSHAFLAQEGNIYNITLLREHLGKLETLEEYKNKGTTGILEFDDQQNITFKPKNIKEANFPVDRSQDNTGGIIIYEQPENKDFHFIYIAGLDPYMQDGKGESLGSCFIFKRSTLYDLQGDILVAEYTGRPKTVKEYNENSRRLLIYYNAICLYENQFINFKEHLVNTNSLRYLAKTPRLMKSSVVESRTFGLGRTQNIALELEQYSSNWLEAVNPKGGINLDHIYSKNLIKELISYDGQVNTDRVIAFQLCICYNIELTKQKSVERNKQIKEEFWQKKFFL